MRLVLFLKGTVIYRFLNREYYRNRIAFLFILLVIVFHVGANIIRSNIFPVFIYSMYSEPQYEMPTTTSRYVFIADGRPVFFKNIFVEGRVSAPIERYLDLIRNMGENSTTNKRIALLSYFLSKNVVRNLKKELYTKSVVLSKFKSWYKKYFAQYHAIKYSKLEVYEYLYSIDNLEKPKQINFILSFYE